MKDQTNLIDSLKKSIKFNDPCLHMTDCFDTLILIEIKIGDKFRNFNVTSLNYYGFNPSVKIFRETENIKNLFGWIFYND